MKAIVIDHPGSADVLRVDTVPDPQQGPQEVLIQVAYAGLNFTDVMARQGVHLTSDVSREFPLVPGTEVAGIVMAVGDKVKNLAVGERVVSFVQGAYAQRAVARAVWCWRVPDEVRLPDALTALVQGLSALLMLREVTRIQPRETVLVHSGAGGVGSLAVQIARHLGAGQVFATASTAAKRRTVEQLGAMALDYTSSAWADDLLQMTNARGVDVALDAVGGRVSEETLHVLAPGARCVVYGLTSKDPASLSGSQLMAGNHTLVGFWLTSWMQNHPKLPVPELLDWLQHSVLTPAAVTVFPLEDAAAAHLALARRESIGKLVLEVG